MKQPTLSTAVRDMISFHAGQYDKSGVPYHHHPYRVMLRLGHQATETERIAALFHDVVEDTSVGLKDLLEFGYSEYVVEAVDLLTLYKPDTHRQYLQRLIDSNNVSAMRVKLADLYDNSWLKRLDFAPVEIRDDLKKMIEQRYKPAIMLMREALGHNAEGIVEGDIEGDFPRKLVSSGY